MSAPEIESLKELINERMNHIKQSLDELKGEFTNSKKMVYSHEHDIENIKQTNTVCKESCTKRIENIELKQAENDKDFGLLKIALKNPRITIIIIVALIIAYRSPELIEVFKGLPLK